MRQFLRRKLGLSSRMLACSRAFAPLVLGAGAPHRLAPPDGSAVAGTVDVTVVADSANADFERTTRAAEETMAVDHLSPGRRRFWTRARCRAMLHLGTSRRSPR